jgi:hypothetical protein
MDEVIKNVGYACMLVLCILLIAFSASYFSGSYKPNSNGNKTAHVLGIMLGVLSGVYAGWYLYDAFKSTNTNQETTPYVESSRNPSYDEIMNMPKEYTSVSNGSKQFKTDPEMVPESSASERGTLPDGAPQFLSQTHQFKFTN